MIGRATPDLYDGFIAIRSNFNTALEERKIPLLYEQLFSVNFSQEVLAVRPQDLAVLSVSEVGWSDLGEPNRVLTTLSSFDIEVPATYNG